MVLAGGKPAGDRVLVAIVLTGTCSAGGASGWKAASYVVLWSELPKVSRNVETVIPRGDVIHPRAQTNDVVLLRGASDQRTRLQGSN